ncbi:lytic transglycosylase domain-containing protein [uncultured Ilyobacter sp.]|uniref:lytic transglycosylase domain-containing protein n=1 Tax=uncultured Ilyobacter sp. TaxID=544433 RepID=UPI0029F4AEF1|nr:lytic transglycosylase domain-containing protein [uncultured Ilyobacter sp.]
MKKTKLYPYPHMKNSNKDNMKLISVLLFLVLTVLLLFNLHKKEIAIESLKNEILQIQLNENENEKQYMEKEMQYMKKLKNNETLIEKQKNEIEELEEFKLILEKVKEISKGNVDEKEALAVAKALYDVHGETGIGWEILASIIMVESSYRPDIISNDPSYGLMQLTYNVGRDIGKKMDKKKIVKNDLLDIERNIYYGAYYLLKQIIYFSNVSDGIMAYNLGAGRVNKLKDEYRGKLESKYLKKVKKYYRGIKN